MTKTNFDDIREMRLESDNMKGIINDCGSMIRKYQDDDKKTFVFYFGNKLSNLQKKKKFSNKNLENVEDTIDV